MHIQLFAVLVLALVPLTAVAQDRMPPIPADKLTAAQRTAIEEFKAARSAEISGPFDPGSIDTPAQMAAADYQDNIVFSTRDLRDAHVSFDTSLSGNTGTTCPDGYALNLCGENFWQKPYPNK